MRVANWMGQCRHVYPMERHPTNRHCTPPLDSTKKTPSQYGVVGTAIVRPLSTRQRKYRRNTEWWGWMAGPAEHAQGRGGRQNDGHRRCCPMRHGRRGGRRKPAIDSAILRHPFALSFPSLSCAPAPFLFRPLLFAFLSIFILQLADTLFCFPKKHPSHCCIFLFFLFFFFHIFFFTSWPIPVL